MGRAARGKPRGAIVMALLLALLIGARAEPAWGYTPESPEVQRMVQRAVSFLEANRGGSHAGLLGCSCLVGLALHKAGRPASHERIQEAVARCERDAGNRGDLRSASVYSLGLSIVFLSELDAEKHHETIELLLQDLYRRQKPHGGWGYADKKTGDISQTQYAVLACWTAHRGGAPVSQSAVERVCNWLLRVQSPEGAWGYQAIDPGVGVFRRVTQDSLSTRLSLNAAALGSIYIAADLLQLLGTPQAPREKGPVEALTLVRDQPKTAARNPISNQVPIGYLREVLAMGNQTFARRFNIETRIWQHYYLYGLERYMSFREFAEGRDAGNSGWYDQGVRLLMSKQAESGGFSHFLPGGRRSDALTDGGALVDTSFAILFLLRSTMRSIRRATLNDGLLVGGRGLPRDTSEVHLDGGNVVRASIFGQVEDLLSILENPDNPDFEDLVRFNEKVTLGDEEDLQKSHTDRLKELVTTGEYRARRLAVRSLARGGEIGNAPILIFALSDPDPRVASEARDGLRFLSRKFRGFNLPDQPNDIQRREAAAKWKAWYRSIRPDAVFVD